DLRWMPQRARRSRSSGCAAGRGAGRRLSTSLRGGGMMDPDAGPAPAMIPRHLLASEGSPPMTDTLTPVRPGKLIINGEAVDAASGKTFTTHNPATEEPLCAVAEAGVEDVDRAVQAARAAFDSGPWPRLKPSERQRLLWKLAELIEKNADEIARLETLDNGKPIFESRQIDLAMVVNTFQYFAGWATKLGGDTLPVSPAYFTYTLREPLGVVGAIIPWN